MKSFFLFLHENLIKFSMQGQFFNEEFFIKKVLPTLIPFKIFIGNF